MIINTNNPNNEPDFLSLDRVKSLFSKNLRLLLQVHQMTQKDLSRQTGIMESTVSGYCNGNLPSCDSLIKIKALFPDVSIDALLTEDMESVLIPNTHGHSSSSVTDIDKFYGTYYLYYLNSQHLDSHPVFFRSDRYEEQQHTERGLLIGILYVYRDPQLEESLSCGCYAALGMENRIYANQIKDRLKKMTPAMVREYFMEQFSTTFYQGQLSLTAQNMFISMQHQYKDRAFMVFRHTENKKSLYNGGLGTINSVSTGSSSDPIMQLIALSRNECRLADNVIKQHLTFQAPSSDVGQELDVILSQIEKLTETEDRKNTCDNMDFASMKQYIPLILKARINDLIDQSVKRYKLSFQRVLEQYDQQWYHLIKEADEYYRKNGGDQVDEYYRKNGGDQIDEAESSKFTDYYFNY